MNRDEYKALSRASRTGLKQAARFTANGTRWAVSRYGVTRLHQSAGWLIERPVGAEIALALGAAAFCRRLNPRHTGGRDALRLARKIRLAQKES